MIGRALFLFALGASGCTAIAGIDAPTLRDDAVKSAAPEASEDAGVGEHREDAAVAHEAGVDDAPRDASGDTSSCGALWSFCTLSCNDNDTPEACLCDPSCACLETVLDFQSDCTKADYTTFACTDSNGSAIVTCIQ